METEEVILSPDEMQHEEYEITSVPIETTTVQNVKRADIRDLTREAHYQTKLLQQENEGKDTTSNPYRFETRTAWSPFVNNNLSKSIA